jgi:hypothetical protein
MADFRHASESRLFSGMRHDSEQDGQKTGRSLPRKLLIQIDFSGEPETHALLGPVER